VQHSQIVGRTRWRRFAALAIPAGIIVAGLFAGVANGQVPVALNVSGQKFKVSADELTGDGFAQYPGYVQKANGAKIPVAASAIDHATLKNLCQSVVMDLGVTKISLLIRAGRGSKTASADNLLIGLDNLQGDATFTNIRIGTDASVLTEGGPNKGAAGDFGQEAEKVVITDLKQSAYSTQAGTFTLDGLNMGLNFSGAECYTDSTTQS
jgi:hypothetical protein